MTSNVSTRQHYSVNFLISRRVITSWWRQRSAVYVLFLRWFHTQEINHDDKVIILLSTSLLATLPELNNNTYKWDSPPSPSLSPLPRFQLALLPELPPRPFKVSPTLSTVLRGGEGTVRTLELGAGYGRLEDCGEPLHQGKLTSLALEFPHPDGLDRTSHIIIFFAHVMVTVSSPSRDRLRQTSHGLWLRQWLLCRILKEKAPR